MRIVQVANFYGPRSGGLRTTMHALGSGYLAAGHESVLVVPGARFAVDHTPAGRRVTVPGRAVPRTGGYRVITDVGGLQALLADLAPDRLEVSDRTTLRGLGTWGRQRGVPSVAWVHERADGVVASAAPWAPDLATRRLIDRHNRQLVGTFDRVVATTAFAAEELERIGAPNLVRVPLGVDLETFGPHQRHRPLRTTLADTHETLLVLCSRLSTEKKPDLAVETLRALRDQGVPARLVVAGTGPTMGLMRERSRGLPVTFVGFVSNRSVLARLLATADVVLAPGPIETFGLAALEAMASGTPVVASSTSALGEVVGDDGGATASPDGDALAGAVARVLATDEPRRRAAARRRAEQFPWSATVETMLALHDNPIDAGAWRPTVSTLSPALPRARTAALVRASYARTVLGTRSEARGGDGPRVLALGDSVALGVGDLVEPGERPGWAAHAAVALGAGTFANLASLGARAATVAEEQLTPALALAPDVVLVSAGGNDVLRGDLRPGDVQEATFRYVEALSTAGVEIVLMRLPDAQHVSWMPRRLRDVLQHRITAVNSALDLVCEHTSVRLVSLPASGGSRLAGEPGRGALWHVDRIHPGPLGHRRLADAAVSALAARGFDRVDSVPDVTTAAPGATSQLGWLVRNGAPWLAKRSVDLAPALGRQLLAR